MKSYPFSLLLKVLSIYLFTLLLSWSTFAVAADAKPGAGVDTPSQAVDAATKLEAQSLQEIFKIYSRYQDLPEILKDSQFQQINMQAWTQITANQFEDHLKSAHISYVKSEVTKTDVVVFGRKFEVLKYPVFQITSGSDVDQPSRMVKGLLLKADPTLKLVFDPLFETNSGGAGGHYDPSINTIVLSMSFFFDVYYNTQQGFRHEFQHYLEERKIVRGEHSLARFSFFYGTADKNIYSKSFRLDELESFWRDARTTRDTAHKAERLKELGLPPEFILTLKGFAAKYQVFKMDIMRSMIQDAKKALENFKDASPIGAKVSDDRLRVIYNINTSYKMLVITLSDVPAQDDALISKKALEEVDFALKRIEQIESQLPTVSPSH